jgi:molybdate transport system substrate-binding protein
MIRMAAALALALAAGVWTQDGAKAPITVSAAISLTNALEEIVVAYAGAGGGPVRLNLAGSNALARQIVNGAPADVFISADEAQMLVVEQAGRIVPGSRVDLLANQLAIVTAPDRAAFVKSQFARRRRRSAGLRSAIRLRCPPAFTRASISRKPDCGRNTNGESCRR